jgi:3-hydroxyacyl-[acyl-carrier-protein] dehydratase
MRFLFYDRVTGIEKGKSITGIKTFALSEEFLKKHFSRVALVPGVILIETMAQLLGWLIMYSHDFSLAAIMTLIENVTVSSHLRPGFKAEVHAEIISTSKRDSLGRAHIYSEGELIASMNRIIYSHFHKIEPEELKDKFQYYSGLKLKNPDSPGP